MARFQKGDDLEMFSFGVFGVFDCTSLLRDFWWWTMAHQFQPPDPTHPEDYRKVGILFSFEAVELLELVTVELVELIPCQVIASANLHKASPRAGRCCERKNMLQSH